MKTIEEFYEDKFIDFLYQENKNNNKKVVIPEGDEKRVIKSLIYTPNYTKVLIGNPEEIIESIYVTHRNNNPEEIMKWVEIIDEKTLGDNQELLDLLLEKRKGKLDLEGAKELLKKPNYYATLMLEAGHVDALVGGSRYSTADILKPAFQIIKTKPGKNIVSSVFILRKGDNKLFFADCAVNTNPNSEQLAEIAVQTTDTIKELNINPRVAMLSYSSQGSGSGPDVDLVTNAVKIIREKYPEYKNEIDGEFQFDAAFDLSVAKLKVKDSKIAGHANGYIFPNLSAGNIAAKVAERIGGYEAIGPILQGLNRPVNDLSRGTTPETIAKVLLISLR